MQVLQNVGCLQQVTLGARDESKHNQGGICSFSPVRRSLCDTGGHPLRFPQVGASKMAQFKTAKCVAVQPVSAKLSNASVAVREGPLG